MYLADYHMHSKYSCDGKMEISTMCDLAIERGFSEIAITDHVDISSDLPYDYYRDLEATGGDECQMDIVGLYKELAEKQEFYKGKLVLRAGAELGQPHVNPAAGEAFVNDYGSVLDFVLGSVHAMENDTDVYYMDYETMNVAEMYDKYVESLIGLAKFGNFDVMGHLTYPLRWVYQFKRERLDLKPYEERFRTLFKLLIEEGRGIELNVSGLYREIKETMPPMSLIKLYKECGGEVITIGSDAHTEEHLGLYQKEGREMLQEAGFRYFTTFEKRKPIFLPFK